MAVTDNGTYQWVDDPDCVDWMNDLCENAPECCWDDDVDQPEIILRYVRHLEAEVQRLGGTVHRWDHDE
jgi:hypothetical protein